MVTICPRAEVSSLWVPSPAGLIPRSPKVKTQVGQQGYMATRRRTTQHRSHQCPAVLWAPSGLLAEDAADQGLGRSCTCWEKVTGKKLQATADGVSPDVHSTVVWDSC